MNRRWPLLIIACALFMWLGYLKTSRAHDLPQGQINIEVAPAEADIMIDGRQAPAGENEVDIGPHKVKVAMEGFSAYENTVDVTQSTPVYI
ncbi:MAG TPA: PEGA domain-containing protein, partial [Candidatus Saccharimonadales bacterium]|nr:PEGA domain-containing protein [Candidatus Saccharimonadales bacterium]